MIPMTTEIGLIEWVSDTQPVRDSSDGLAKDTAFQKRNEALLGAIGGKKPRDLDRIGVSGQGSNAFAARSLQQEHEGHGRRGRVQGQRVQPRKLPRHVQDGGGGDGERPLRADKRRGAVGPPAPRAHGPGAAPRGVPHHAQRVRAVLATFSIAGYVLGIGDRHLDNYLIDKRSGKLVPIDFGASFGSRTRRCPSRSSIRSASARSYGRPAPARLARNAQASLYLSHAGNSWEQDREG